MLKKFLVAMVLIGLAMPSWAQRSLPEDMDMAVMQDVRFPTIVLSPDGFSWLKILTLGWLDNAKAFQMSQGVRVRDKENRFIVWGLLSQYRGNAVAVRRDAMNQINEVWILTPAEQEVFHQRAIQKKAMQNP